MYITPALVLGLLNQLGPYLADLVSHINLAPPYRLWNFVFERCVEPARSLAKRPVSADLLPLGGGPAVEVGHDPGVTVVLVTAPTPRCTAGPMRLVVRVIHAVEGEFNVGDDAGVRNSDNGAVDHAEAVQVSSAVDDALLFAHDVELRSCCQFALFGLISHASSGSTYIAIVYQDLDLSVRLVRLVY